MAQAPQPYEDADHIAFVQAVNASLNLQWEFIHVPNGEKRDKRTAAKLKRMGTRPGVPDFIFFGPRHVLGGVVFIELKRRGKKIRLSPNQMTFRDFVMRAGFNYWAFNDTADALGELYGVGIIRAQVSA